MTVMESDEIMTSIFVPFPPSASGTSYKHISARGRVDISAVCVGAMVRMEGEVCSDVKIVLGAVAPTPMRAIEAEKAIKGKKLTERNIDKASEIAMTEASPITDVRASADYRRKMVSILTGRALKEARERAMKN